MDYYSLFWGPGVICTINEPRGVFSCRSSTLTVLANSGPFRGLLRTVLGSQSDFREKKPRVEFTCWSSTLTVLHDYGRLLDYYSLFGVPK